MSAQMVNAPDVRVLDPRDAAGWASSDFDDETWTSATAWSAAELDPKDGYDEVSWDSTAQLIWGTDLEIDNTILLRKAVS